MKAEVFEVQELIGSAKVLGFRHETQATLIIFDDALSLAEDVANQLKQEIEKNSGSAFKVSENLAITATNDFKNVQTLLQQHSINVFLVIDIHHGAGKEEYGLAVIKQIKTEITPKLFIVAYSTNTNQSLQKKAKEAGADLFAKKSARDWDADKKKIAEAVFEHFIPNITKKEFKEETFLAEYKAVVLNVNREQGVVHLEIEDLDDIFDKFYSIEWFNGIDLVIDMPLSLCFYKDAKHHIIPRITALPYEKTEADWSTRESLKPKFRNVPIEKDW